MGEKRPSARLRPICRLRYSGRVSRPRVPHGLSLQPALRVDRSRHRAALLPRGEEVRRDTPADSAASCRSSARPSSWCRPRTAAARCTARRRPRARVSSIVWRSATSARPPWAAASTTSPSRVEPGRLLRRRTATGGLWKTINNGTTWEVLFDDLDDVVSIGDVAIAPDDPNLVWVGTRREQQPPELVLGQGRLQVHRRRPHLDAHGARRHRSTSAASSSIPIDHDVVYVAALGTCGARTGERGVFKTTDGGLTWTQRAVRRRRHRRHRPRDGPVEQQGALRRHLPAPPGRRGASTAAGRAAPSTSRPTAGRTWTKLTTGLPAGPLGRIGLDVYRAEPERRLRARRAREGERRLPSDDAGHDLAEDVSDANPRPMYFSQIRIDPNDDRRIYVLGVQPPHLRRRRQDVLENAVDARRPPCDVDRPGQPEPPDRRQRRRRRHLAGIAGADVGLLRQHGPRAVLPRRLRHGRAVPRLRRPAGQRRRGAARARSAAALGIGNDDWFAPSAAATASWRIADPTDARIVYTESQDGNIVRVDRADQRAQVDPSRGRRKGEPPLRWNWNTPIVISPHDPDTLYVGANKVFKSTRPRPLLDGHQPRPDRRHRPRSLSLMGVAAKDFTHRQARRRRSPTATSWRLPNRRGSAGVSTPAPTTARCTCRGTTGRTGRTSRRRFPGVPKDTYVSRAGGVGVRRRHACMRPSTATGSDDYGTYVYASADCGNTWPLDRVRPAEGPQVAVHSPRTRGTRSCCTRAPSSACSSRSIGAAAGRGSESNLPTVPIHEIALHPARQRHDPGDARPQHLDPGRPRPMQQASEAMKAEAFLFDIRAGRRVQPRRRPHHRGGPSVLGEEPAGGAPSASSSDRRPGR